MNSRFITSTKATKAFTLLLFWMPVAFFSVLLIRNTIPYFSFRQGFSFIQERAILFLQPAYKACFYIHIFAGMFCIGAALLQFSSYVIKRRRTIHVYAGRIYVVVVILLGAPTGLYMSFFAKGGFAERGLFMFMAICWFYFTLKGFTSILQKKVLAHKIWMIRSYSMALTAVTFRVYYIVLYLGDVQLLQNYMVSLWISVIGNMLIAEFIIWKKSRNYLASFTT
jgi:hypothetical protein